MSQFQKQWAFMEAIGMKSTCRTSFPEQDIDFQL
jgi:hypothetical protein